MPMELNKVFLYGNLARDPEIRHTQSGKQVANFAIAVNNRRGGNEETMFIKIEAWNKTAELCDRYLKKGSPVLIEGRLKIDEYETREGEKRRDPVVVAFNVEFGPKSDGSGGGSSSSNYSGGGRSGGDYTREEPVDAPSRDEGIDEDPGDTEDDLPF